MVFSTREIFGFEDRLPFGKYKGEKVVIIMAKDSGYIKYLFDHGTQFELPVEKCLASMKTFKFIGKKSNNNK